MCNQFVSVSYITKYCQWVYISHDNECMIRLLIFSYPYMLWILTGPHRNMSNVYLNKFSDKNRFMYLTVNHLIYRCEWTFLLVLQTSWITKITLVLNWIKYVLKRVSFGSKECIKDLKPEFAYFRDQTS